MVKAAIFDIDGTLVNSVVSTRRPGKRLSRTSAKTFRISKFVTR